MTIGTEKREKIKRRENVINILLFQIHQLLTRTNTFTIPNFNFNFFRRWIYMKLLLGFLIGMVQNCAKSCGIVRKCVELY